VPELDYDWDARAKRDAEIIRAGDSMPQELREDLLQGYEASLADNPQAAALYDRELDQGLEL
jgi:hypothetical protein